MTTNIQVIDRDEAVVQAKEESEIAKLVRQIMETREELQICEANLAAIEESLSGKAQISST